MINKFLHKKKGLYFKEIKLDKTSKGEYLSSYFLYFFLKKISKKNIKYKKLFLNFILKKLDYLFKTKKLDKLLKEIKENKEYFEEVKNTDLKYLLDEFKYYEYFINSGLAELNRDIFLYSSGVKLLVDKTIYINPEINKEQYNNLNELLEKNICPLNINTKEINESKKKRIEKFFTISEKEYIILFGDEDEEKNIGQTNTANCYLVNGLHILRNIQNLKPFIKSSIKIKKDGWEVKIPLGDKNGKWIRINKNDINIKKGEKGSKYYQKYTVPVLGPLGIQILEAAYNIYQYGENNRIKSEYGFTNNVLETLIGKDYFYKNRKRIIHKTKNRNDFLNLLKVYELLEYSNNNNGIIHCSLKQHSYSVDYIDRINKKVYVSDPFKTSKKLIYSYEDFYKNFNTFYYLEINFDKLYEDFIG